MEGLQGDPELIKQVTDEHMVVVAHAVEHIEEPGEYESRADPLIVAGGEGVPFDIHVHRSGLKRVVERKAR